MNKLAFTFVFLIYCLTEASCGDPMKTMIAAFRKSCQRKINVPLEAANELYEGNFNNRTEKLEEFAACLLKMARVMKNGRISASEMHRVGEMLGLPSSTEAHSASLCGNTRGRNENELAFNVIKCIWETVPNPTLYFKK